MLLTLNLKSILLLLSMAEIGGAAAVLMVFGSGLWLGGDGERLSVTLDLCAEKNGGKKGVAARRGCVCPWWHGR